jgi:2'-deoxynucleoside 5'-phosphate N-hydrolase
MVRIYFAGSISSSQRQVETYATITALLAERYAVSSDAADSELFHREASMTSRQIYGQEMLELAQADVVVAEISHAALGVGYQIAHAERLGKPVLCLVTPGDRVSPMIIGSPRIEVELYDDPNAVVEIVDAFVARHGLEAPAQQPLSLNADAPQ